MWVLKTFQGKERFISFIKSVFKTKNQKYSPSPTSNVVKAFPSLIQSVN